MNINYKNIPVHVDVYGQGEAVVLIHGFLENNKMWRDIIPILEDHYFVIAPDLFGHGKTPSLAKVHTMEEMADMIAVVLDQLEVKSARLIGHSMGGYITMAFAEHHPERLKALLLLDSSPFADSEVRLKEREQVIRIVQKRKRAFLNAAVSNYFAAENREKYQDRIQTQIEEAFQMSSEAIIAAVKGMKIRKNRTEILKRFPRKKWIIAGEEDPLIPFEDIRETARKTRAEFYGCAGGHMSFIEQQERVHQLVLDFLKD